MIADNGENYSSGDDEQPVHVEQQANGGPAHGICQKKNLNLNMCNL